MPPTGILFTMVYVCLYPRCLLEFEHNRSNIQGLATRGVGAICMEATAVLPEARVSPEDAVSIFSLSVDQHCLIISSQTGYME